MEIKKRLEFKNRNIARYKSDFTGDKERVYTSFKFDKTLTAKNFTYVSTQTVTNIL